MAVGISCRWLEAAAEQDLDPTALLPWACDWTPVGVISSRPMEASVYDIPPGIRRAMDYGKLAGPAPRMLVLRSRYWLDDACIRAAQTLDWPVRTVPVTQEGVLPQENIAQLLQSIVEFRPDFILTVNLGGIDEEGSLARLFDELHLPYVVWFADDPRTIMMDRSIYASPYAAAFTWDSAYCGYLAACGFPVARTLPLAADPALFNSGPASSWQHPPTFVGNSMTAAARAEWGWVNQRPHLAAAVSEALDSGRVTREQFAQGLTALLDPPFVASLDAHERRHAEILLFSEGTHRLRCEFVRALEPEGIDVRGDNEWVEFFPRVGGPINYEHDLTGFYRACEVNLNITSIQMATAANQRVFDCPAAGGFLLTDAQHSLASLFDPDQLAVFHSFNECRDLLRWYRAKPRARTEMVTKARLRILDQHTYAHRLRHIEDTLRQYLK
ncbi:MAG TPA: glycosyltransferase [Candidatus Bathyarchaeia archaeon]|nr:glycosyltransferase [Candidatus Bathyarchaeia archaeon]